MQQIVQLDLSFGWAFGVKWSPSGNTLAYAGKNLSLALSAICKPTKLLFQGLCLQLFIKFYRSCKSTSWLRYILTSPQLTLVGPQNLNSIEVEHFIGLYNNCSLAPCQLVNKQQKKKPSNTILLLLFIVHN